MTDFVILHKITDFVHLSPFLLPQISYSFHHFATALTEKENKRMLSYAQHLGSLGGKSMQQIDS